MDTPGTAWRMHGGRLRTIAFLLLALPLLAACSRGAPPAERGQDTEAPVRMPRVTVSGDDSGMNELNWQPPAGLTAGPADTCDSPKP